MVELRGIENRCRQLEQGYVYTKPGARWLSGGRSRTGAGAGIGLGQAEVECEIVNL
jgi:hypothetical protein